MNIPPKKQEKDFGVEAFGERKSNAFFLALWWTQRRSWTSQMDMTAEALRDTKFCLGGKFLSDSCSALTHVLASCKLLTIVAAWGLSVHGINK